VFINENGHICLSEFSSRYYLNNVNNNPNQIIATPEYIGIYLFYYKKTKIIKIIYFKLAPELLLGFPTNKVSDWWTLGILLYFLFHKFILENKFQ